MQCRKRITELNDDTPHTERIHISGILRQRDPVDEFLQNDRICVRLEDIKNLRQVRMPDAFQEVVDSSISGLQKLSEKQAFSAADMPVLSAFRPLRAVDHAHKLIFIFQRLFEP